MKTVKWIGVSHVMNLAAGGLCHKAIYEKMADDDKAAMLILLLTLIAIIGVFCTVGVRRWRAGSLSNFEKRIMVFPMFAFPVMFVVGWFANIF
jgi:uncharacterized membrane protein YhaH (DUF805 family)